MDPITLAMLSSAGLSALGSAPALMPSKLAQENRARLEALRRRERAGELGLILTTLGESVLRVCPAFNLSQSEADRALEIIDSALNDVEKGKIPDSAVASLSPWWFLMKLFSYLETFIVSSLV